MTIPVTWSPKDPDEIVNYSLPWAEQMAAGATIVTSVWSDVAGAVLELDTIADDNLSTIAKVSGGVDGTEAGFTNTITTTDGETLEQRVLLPIVATVPAELEPYAVPRPSDLAARYPAFAGVPYATLAIHINDALTGADTSWNAGDYQPAILALAAHNMSLLGIGEQSEVAAYARQGLTGLRDGAFSMNLSDKAVGAACGGTFDATPYGRLYKVLLRRNKAGPRLVGGPLPGGGWGPLAQQNDGGILPWPGF